MMGGLTIMSTWLSQAAIEEQTSVIHVIFKVLIFFFGEHVMYLSGSCIFFYSYYLCRCCSTFRYIRLYQSTCRLFCKQLIGCGFIEHKVCINHHKASLFCAYLLDGGILLYYYLETWSSKIKCCWFAPFAMIFWISDLESLIPLRRWNRNSAETESTLRLW